MTKKNKDNLIIINLTSHKPPEFKEVRGKEWIFYGKNNDYPLYLINLFNRSSKHSSIVNSKIDYVAGGGWSNDYIINGEKETLDDLTKKIALDLEIFGGFAIEVIWSRTGLISELRHVDFSKIRSDKNNEKFYFTKDWIKIYDDGSSFPNSSPDRNEDWAVYDYFNPLQRNGKQLYYFKSYRPNINVYTLPEYLGAIPYIEMDYNISSFWYNAVKFGFSASHLFNFYNGNPTPEEKRKLEDSIKKKWTGPDSECKFLLNFADSKERGAEIITLTQPDLDKQFAILNKTIQEEIFSGHRITSPMLMGIKTEGQLGGRNEIIEANELFQNRFVKPKQDMLKKALMPLFENMKNINPEIALKQITPIGLDWTNPSIVNIYTDDEKREKLGLEKQKIKLELTDVINSFSPLVSNAVLKYLTPNEVRAMAKLPALPGGDVIESAQSNNIQMKAQDEFMIEYFREKGVSKKKYKNIARRPVTYEMSLDLQKSEKEFATVNKCALADVVKVELRPKQSAILDLLKKDPFMPDSQIAKALDIDQEQIGAMIDAMIEDKLLAISERKSGDDKIPKYQITPKAERRIKQSDPAPTAHIFVMYSYEWLEEFSDKDSNTSRPFCVELRNMTLQGKMWSRKDIEAISAETGRNVWEMRGGWYTKPGTDIRLPFCRHQWFQNIVTEET